MMGRANLSELVAATPGSRKRSIDFLRAASILLVVLGHQLLAVLGWRDGSFTGENLLQLDPSLHVVTWVFQVVPIFFLVGGYANIASWRSAVRGRTGYVGWLRTRAARLLRPSLVFVTVWTVLPLGAVVLGLLPSGIARVGGREVALPLWFLASYLLVVAAIPPLAAVHERAGAWTLAGLAGIVVVADVLRFGAGVPEVGLLNHLATWLAVVELGFCWHDGVLTRRPGLAWVFLLGGLASLTALTTVGGYPVSMIHLSDLARSNAFPPSLAMLALAVAQCGFVLLVDRALNGWLQRPRVWAATILANSVVMTTYLWNMTAVVLAAVLVFPTGVAPQPEPLTAVWWLLRPVWVALCTLCLIPFVLAFRWAERPGTPRPGGDGVLAISQAVLGSLLAATGFSYLAVHAFPVPGEEVLWPAVGLVCLVAGAVLLRAGFPLPRRSTPR